jgi:hypothetical protein
LNLIHGLKGRLEQSPGAKRSGESFRNAVVGLVSRRAQPWGGGNKKRNKFEFQYTNVPYPKGLKGREK